MAFGNPDFDVFQLPEEHEALREAVVNALIHADYRGQGGVVIERFADRIEVDAHEVEMMA